MPEGVSRIFSSLSLCINLSLSQGGFWELFVDFISTCIFLHKGEGTPAAGGEGEWVRMGIKMHEWGPGDPGPRLCPKACRARCP